MLADDKKKTLKLIDFFIKKKKTIFFAVEELKLSSKNDLKKIKEILLIKKFYMRDIDFKLQ
jgi:hypothetical protein